MRALPGPRRKYSHRPASRKCDWTWIGSEPVSRKVQNLVHAVSLHFMHYNFACPHQSLKQRYPRTPAMAAGVADHVWSLEEIAALLD